MTNNILNKTTTGTIKMKVGEWKYITSEPFYTLFKDKNIFWHSVDSNIVQVNPNSGLLYACDIGTTTILGTDVNQTTVEVFCSIEVEASELSLKSEMLPTGTDSTMSTRCVEGDIIAMGYSSTIFEYNIVGSRVTLKKGLAAKNGTRSIYSNLFRSKLVEMKNIYEDMTPQQREAWIKLRISDFISLVGIFNPQSVTKTAENIAKEILLGYGIDLGGMLEATILGVYNWYEAEEEAKEYFDAF